MRQVIRRTHVGQSAVQLLEPRKMLSATATAASTALRTLRHTTVSSPIVTQLKLPTAVKTRAGSTTTYITGTTTPRSGLTPQQVRGAYGITGLSFNGITADGSGQTIAILDPGDDTGLVNSTSTSFASSDLAIFDAYYGLPNPTFTKMGFTSGTPVLTTTLPSAGTADDEISLDVEWAHVIAPKASILLVEGAADFSDIFNGILAIDAAAASMHITALSMSFGGAEAGDESSTANAEGVDGHYFDQPNLTYIASTGDGGAYTASATVGANFPASSSNVLAVGGTTLNVSGTSYASETTWGNGTSSYSSGGGGGGISAYEPVPTYQVGNINGLSSTHRTIPDVSMLANPSTGVEIYDSPDYGSGTGWYPGTLGGTSLSAPLMSGIIAIADQGRALKGLAALASSGGAGVAASNPNGNSASLDVHTLLYGFGYSNSDFHDITGGNSIGPTSYGPGTHYDLSTGLGSPVGNNLTADLSGLYSVAAVNVPAISTLYVKQSSATQISVWVNSATPGVGTPTATYPLSSVSGITDIGAAGNDTLTLDYSNGNFAAAFSNGASTSTIYPATPSLPIIYTGLGTANTLVIVGSSANDVVTATATLVTPSGGVGTTPITITNIQALQFVGGSGGSDTLNVTASPTGGYTVNADTAVGTANISLNVVNTGTAVLLAATQHLASLVIGSGASVTLNSSSTSGVKVLVTSAIAVSGKLNLTNNGLILNYTGGNDPLSMVASEIVSAYNGGGASAWTGNGITSSAANAGQYGVGYAEASAIGAAGGTFLGQAVGANAILVRYTLYGDANLDGTVNAADFVQLSNNFGATASAWNQGNFNYDNTTDASDFVLLSNNFGDVLI